MLLVTSVTALHQRPARRYARVASPLTSYSSSSASGLDFLSRLLLFRPLLRALDDFDFFFDFFSPAIRDSERAIRCYACHCVAT